MSVPNPGSEEAIAQGCICPILDNGHGDDELGRIRGFWYTRGCPVHDLEPEEPILDSEKKRKRNHGSAGIRG